MLFLILDCLGAAMRLLAGVARFGLVCIKPAGAAREIAPACEVASAERTDAMRLATLIALFSPIAFPGAALCPYPLFGRRCLICQAFPISGSVSAAVRSKKVFVPAHAIRPGAFCHVSSSADLQGYAFAKLAAGQLNALLEHVPDHCLVWLDSNGSAHTIGIDSLDCSQIRLSVQYMHKFRLAC